MEIYWWFLIPAILCALFADKIDRAVQGNRKVRRIIWIVCVGVCAILLVPPLSSLFA